MYKDCNVVMLPTNEKESSSILLGVLPNVAILTKDVTHEGMKIGKPQHLYITSDEEIKEGDWIYNILSKTHVQFTKDFIEYYSAMNSDFPIKNYRKIIATTDSSLKITKSVTGYTEDRSRTFYQDFPLPKLSQKFIQEYIKNYNEGNSITNVKVEYEDYWIKADYSLDVAYRPVINSDCTISIKPIKES